ncbi:MAG: N-formylglutamate amidohydrolase [Burkholderiales bacterium]|nr:MAG: N-formylglutamate amidohydrolase [Burkholderiales bacterium]
MIRIEAPVAPAVALVFDSPHSGSQYPDDFGHAIDRSILRRSEDAHIEDLFAPVTELGGTLLHALFPRCYLDPNRALEDLDLSMIDGDWPHAVAPSGKTRQGKGLVWYRVKEHGPIYDRKLTAAEVQRRIEQCWQPYHAAISRLLDEAHARHGRFVHVNCHSMASRGDSFSEDGPVARPDFVLGDRDGSSCDPRITETAAAVLRELGYRVAVNDPYKGMELVRRYSNPGRARHSLQIEINRALYMEETTIERSDGYARLKAHLFELMRALAALAREGLG